MTSPLDPHVPSSQRNRPFSRLRGRLATSAVVGTLLMSTMAGTAAAQGLSSTNATTAPPTVVIATHTGALGTFLTNKAGRALYLWEADPKDKSVCTGPCAKFWPPLIGTPKASAGVKQAWLGTLTRADGTKQITYRGHALYYFAEDTRVDSAVGQGSDGFKAKWWVVSLAGKAITKPAVVVTTHTGPLGRYLTDGTGRTLYLWEADPKGISTCTALCATFWPPVLGAPQAAGVVARAGLGTLTRADGTTQATYHGHPLYYFAEDTAPGDTNGQGSDGFKALWYVVNAAGNAITVG